jgi:L-iditol 2-dehydrogenase
MRMMRAAVLYDVDDIRIESRPVPTLNEGELLVQTRASGICTGDIMGWYVRRKAPLVLGHEPAGVIAEIGPGDPPFDDDGRPFAIGDPVFVHHHAPCFACSACARGDYVQCATWRASKIDPGGLAEFFRVPRENVRDTLRLPDTVPFIDGALVEPLACVVKSLRRAGLNNKTGIHSGEASLAEPSPAQTPPVPAPPAVLIIGLGVMGLMHVAVAAESGARVFGSDFNAPRRVQAKRLGAIVGDPKEIEAIVKAATESRGADIVICGPGAPEPLREAIALAAPGGTIVMFTPLEPGTPFAFDATDFYFRDLRLIASYSCGPNDTREALRLIAAGIVTANRLEATEFPLESAPDAYRQLTEARIIKPIVVFN